MSKGVFITGAARRIGKEIALHLANEGYNIAIHCNNSQEQAQELADSINNKGVKSCVIQYDLNQISDNCDLISQAQQQIGNINCLINNASYFKKDLIENFSIKDFNDHMNVNAISALKLSCEFAKIYQGDNGNIINLSDGTNGWSMSAKYLTYALSKMSLDNITDILAPELAPNIRINSIAPGPTIPGHNDDSCTFERLAKRSPLQNTTKVTDILNCIDFILSTRSITGQKIYLNNGMHLHKNI